MSQKYKGATMITVCSSKKYLKECCIKIRNSKMVFKNMRCKSTWKRLRIFSNIMTQVLFDSLCFKQLSCRDLWNICSSTLIQKVTSHHRIILIRIVLLDSRPRSQTRTENDEKETRNQKSNGNIRIDGQLVEVLVGDKLSPGDRKVSRVIFLVNAQGESGPIWIFFTKINISGLEGVSKIAINWKNGTN